MLYTFTMALLIANLVALILSVIKSPPRWIRWWPIALIIFVLLQLIIDGFYQTLLLVYLTSVILSVIGFYRWKEFKAGPKSWFRFIKIGWAILWRITGIVVIAVSTILVLSFGYDSTFLPNLYMKSNVDYSQLGWSEAFEKMNNHLSKDYAFGEWKAIEWNTLLSTYKPKIVLAEQASDTAAYYLALREYIFSIPDGHLGISGNDFGQRKAAIAGSYGFSTIQLDDGRVIAHIILEDGPAEKAGMIWGAEILTWNYQSIQKTIDEVSLLWAPNACATSEGVRINKLNLLSRAPIGQQLNLTFRNPGEKQIYQVIVSAIDDDMALYKKDAMMGLPVPTLDLKTKMVEYRILPEQYGYLKIFMEIPTLGTIDPVGEVHEAVQEFIRADVKGVIIDLRTNGGGIDIMTTTMMSEFIKQLVFYEEVAFKDETGEFKHVGKLMLKPGDTVYPGPVAALVDNYTASTGEGFPLLMQLANRGPVVGFYRTNGSFGMVGSSINLPAGYSIGYPNGASFDKDGNIQVDSDQYLQGGIEPDVRIPLNIETMRAIFVEGRDYVLETAIAALEENTQEDSFE